MSTTPPILRPGQEALDLTGESWIDLTNSSTDPFRTPEHPLSPILPIAAHPGEYLKLLMDAQESNSSSRVVSLAGSRGHSAHGSPRSPPNSPVNEMDNAAHEHERYLQTVFMNGPDGISKKPTPSESPFTYLNYCESDSRSGLSNPRGTEWAWTDDREKIPLDSIIRSNNQSIRKGGLMGKHIIVTGEFICVSVLTLFLGFTFGWLIGRSSTKCVCIS